MLYVASVFVSVNTKISFFNISSEIKSSLFIIPQTFKQKNEIELCEGRNSSSALSYSEISPRSFKMDFSGLFRKFAKQKYNDLRKEHSRSPNESFGRKSSAKLFGEQARVKSINRGSN